MDMVKDVKKYTVAGDKERKRYLSGAAGLKAGQFGRFEAGHVVVEWYENMRLDRAVRLQAFALLEWSRRPHAGGC
jgi:hypothetical protein